jgi:uncharacterized membrane protein (GlpM family)
MYYLPRMVATWYAALRILLVCVFLVPPVTAYLLSFYFLYSEQRFALSLSLGLLVLVVCIANIILELMPWHFGKIFSPTGVRR